jgi:hypothetical protein
MSRSALVPAWLGLCAVLASGAAFADDAAPPTSSQPSPSEPSPAPALPSKAKVFLISPEQSQQDFMCEAGRLQSLLPSALAEHRMVSITLLDQTRNPIPDGVWTSAYGFRLTHKQSVLINVVMICGD